MDGIIRTNANNKDFYELVTLLDKDLHIMDGAESSFFAQFNKLDKIHHVIVAYKRNTPVGCGAIREYSNEIMEIKRMFVRPEHRGQGVAKQILAELELWAKELKYSSCVLETGKELTVAIEFYQKSGYIQIPNYEPYSNTSSSFCMKKNI